MIITMNYHLIVQIILDSTDSDRPFKQRPLLFGLLCIMMSKTIVFMRACGAIKEEMKKGRLGATGSAAEK
jgi:hypothetical protein